MQAIPIEPNWLLVAIATAIFLLTGSLVLLVAQTAKRVHLRRRLQRLEEQPEVSLEQTSSGFVESFIQTSRPLARLVLPDEGWENSPIRAQFMHAGWRSPGAPSIFFGIKAMLTLGMPMVWVLVLVVSGKGSPLLISFGMVMCGLVGLYGPSVVLKQRIQVRQRELFESFPDALDLMTVCTEAGLSLEGALSRVADEMGRSSQLLASELQLVVLEMRAGRGRDVALRNLARRNGLDEIESLVATLVQAEQFGVSVADSLRTHSDLLRARRQQQAEERAATVGTRLTFPLMACILPTLMIIVTGPAALRLITSLKNFGTP